MRDECCFTGEYRGAAHSIYKLKHFLYKTVTIIATDQNMIITFS